MSRAQDIVNDIIESTRYAQVFSERVYRDEPILRTGRDAFGGRADTEPTRDHKTTSVERPQAHPQGLGGATGRLPFGGDQLHLGFGGPKRVTLPGTLRKLRALERRDAGAYLYRVSDARTFFEQARLAADYTDDYWDATYDGIIRSSYPTYFDMTDEELRLYFTWRTHFRAKDPLPGPHAFRLVYAYELISGIGIEPGPEGLAELGRLADACEEAGASGAQMRRWMRDYIVFWGLDPALIPATAPVNDIYTAVSCLKRAQEALLERQLGEWPDRRGAEDGLPEEDELLDALCVTSRYRAERSRFVRERREEYALACARVFARMVDHCHKRRKTEFVEGVFGGSHRISYTMFAQALYESKTRHPDARVEVGCDEAFVCQLGYWMHEVPCRRQETSREIGNLLHAIDCRMRIACQDAHPLKARTLPKYQSKFVDAEIEHVVQVMAAREAARIRIDRSSLKEIRSSAVRVREALLTDEERGEEAATGVAELAPKAVASTVAPSKAQAASPLGEETVTFAGQGQAEAPLGLTASQRQILDALLAGKAVPASGGPSFLSLELDAINEVFLEIVGDTVVEFGDEGPQLVEDYVEEVREALEGRH